MVGNTVYGHPASRDRFGGPNRTAIAFLVARLLPTAAASQNPSDTSAGTKTQASISVGKGSAMGQFGFQWATVPDLFDRFAPAPPLYASVPGVVGMTQDRYGYLWVATRGNLYRCDGLRYLPFDRDISRRPFSGGLNITGIEGGRHGVVCLFTDTDELLFFDVRTNTRRFASLKKTGSEEDLHITCVSEDASGRFWFGSREGDLLRISPPDTVVERVLRYDGGAAGPASAAIRAIAQDSLGDLWIGGDRGLLRLRQETAAENRFRCDTVRGLSSDRIAGLLVARSGRIWICGMDRNVGWIDPVSGKFTPVKPLEAVSPEPGVTRMSEDRNGSIWISFCGNGIQRWAEESRWEKHLQRSDPKGAEYSQKIVSALTDRSGILLVMTSSGRLLRYLPVVPGVHAYVANEGPEPRLSGRDVCALLVDQKRTLWVGKESGGLEYLEPGKRRFGRIVHDPRNRSGLSNDSIECMVERRNGEIWISTLPGEINILEPRSETFKHLDPRPAWESAESRTATTLYEDPHGTLWIGHSAGVDTVSAGSTSIVPCVIWPEDVKARAGYVTSIRRDSQGDVWIGTSRGGLLRQSLAAKGGKWYRHDPADSSSLGSDHVTAVFEDREGRLWTATLAGLSLLDRSSGRFRNHERRLGRRQLLETTEVWRYEPEGYVGIVQDRRGNLLLTCVDGGAARFDVSTWRIQYYGPREGMAFWSGRRGAICITPEGIIYYGGTGGINRLDPERADLPQFIPAVVVTSVLIGEETRLIHGGSERSLELAYDQNNLVFEFAVLDFQDINWNARALILEGWDLDWRGVGDPPNVNYQNLPPGTYTFRVRAQTSDGYIPESEDSVRVTIHPPYWQAWWFRGLALALIGVSLYALYRRRLAKALALERLRLRIADDLHDDIGSRLSGVALHADLLARSLPADSPMRDPLTNIGLTARSAGEDLRDVAWIINPEYDSVPDLVARMRSIAGMMLAAHQYTFESPASSSSVSLGMGFKRHVLMVFKEMLNNIVRHAGATMVRVEVTLTDDSFRLCVADNGVGFDPSAESDGRGLASMRTRAEAIRGVLTVESTPGSGSRICLEADITRSGN